MYSLGTESATVFASVEAQPSFSTRARLALADGLILGLKYGTAVLIICAALAFAAGDYLTTRAKATSAVDWINQQILAAQRAQVPPPAQPK